MAMEPYTAALTSFGRFDLLERTLRSLLPRLDGPLARVLIGEDSGDPPCSTSRGRSTGRARRSKSSSTTRPWGR